MTSKFEIRDATREDLEILVGFNLALALESEGRCLEPEVVRSGVLAVLENRNHGSYLVAETKSSGRRSRFPKTEPGTTEPVARNVVGSLMITTEWSDWTNGAYWWVQSVYVRPEFREQGIYRTLYDAAKKKARRSPGVRGCRLYVEGENRIARKVYEQLGMKETSHRIFEELF